MCQHIDLAELNRTRRGNAAVRHSPWSADDAGARHPVIPTVADSAPEPVIAQLSADEILAVMHDESVNARLELLYCPSVSCDVRTGLANRLGEIDLVSATAACEIEQLYGRLAAAGKVGWDENLDLDVAEIHHRLWRLRDLCRRHQEFRRSAISQ